MTLIWSQLDVELADSQGGTNRTMKYDHTITCSRYHARAQIHIMYEYHLIWHDKYVGIQYENHMG